MVEHRSIRTDGPDPASTLRAAVASPDKVYIVDDDSMVRRALSFSLGIAGFATRAFASGQDFLDEVDMLTPGCVLLDVRMPDIDGLAVLDALGAKRQRFAVVAMTGHGDVDTAVRAMKRGASDFLEKPFTDAAVTDLLSTLARALPVNLDAEADRQAAAARVARLTPREQDVLRGLLAGLSNKAVAHKLGISIRTAEMHRGNLMKRMGVNSVAEAVRVAVSASLKVI